MESTKLQEQIAFGLLASIILGGFFFHDHRRQVAGEAAVTRIHQQLRLGMSSDEVDSILKKEAGLDHYGSSAIEAPNTWGARNWVLLFDYHDDKLCHVRVRTPDSFERRPQGDAPPDLGNPSAR